VPSEAYGEFVRLMVIVCVDLVLRRASDGKVLLVKRGTEPVKGYWWW
jgi:ADP-ribose pyrophosphatase YjhB (NUDIX family)